MRIGILTFHCAHNYGAMLQCYALQEYLVAQGHEVSVVDYRPDYLTHGYVRHALHHWISRNPLRAVKRLLTEPFLYRTRESVGMVLIVLCERSSILLPIIRPPIM